MKLGYITLMIRDMEASLSFYEQLVGLKVLRRFNPGAGEIAFLAHAEGETMLELIQFENVPKVQTQGLTLSFFAGDALESLREKALELGYDPSPILHHPPKPDHFTLTDPDGICVEFTA